mmetsp:Transcript_9229/g.18665  ORF Transcript_9229/g.18665 Transcript_9229/m.18665 type:complete len:291 (-) Transcript_9229:1640-2512(-)
MPTCIRNAKSMTIANCRPTNGTSRVALWVGMVRPADVTWSPASFRSTKRTRIRTREIPVTTTTTSNRGRARARRWIAGGRRRGRRRARGLRRCVRCPRREAAGAARVRWWRGAREEGKVRSMGRWTVVWTMGWTMDPKMCPKIYPKTAPKMARKTYPKMARKAHPPSNAPSTTTAFPPSALASPPKSISPKWISASATPIPSWFPSTSAKARRTVPPLVAPETPARDWRGFATSRRGCARWRTTKRTWMEATAATAIRPPPSPPPPLPRRRWNLPKTRPRNPPKTRPLPP